MNYKYTDVFFHKESRIYEQRIYVYTYAHITVTQRKGLAQLAEEASSVKYQFGKLTGEVKEAMNFTSTQFNDIARYFKTGEEQCKKLSEEKKKAQHQIHKYKDKNMVSVSICVHSSSCKCNINRKHVHEHIHDNVE